MPVITLITPVYEPNPEFFRAAYESVRAQTMPSGWDLEWLVQEDGTSGIAREVLGVEEDWITYGTGRHRGVATARNLALSDARGTLVKNLDQDDVLTPGCLARDIEALTQDGVHWATSRVLDLLPDGSHVGFPGDPDPGVIEHGSVFHYWRSHNYRASVHPTTLCIRRSLAAALGGWTAIPGSDDTGLLIAASVTSTGWFTDEVGLLYRKHAEQESAVPEHNAGAEWHSRMRLIEMRAENLQTLQWTVPDEFRGLDRHAAQSGDPEVKGGNQGS